MSFQTRFGLLFTTILFLAAGLEVRASLFPELITDAPKVAFGQMAPLVKQASDNTEVWFLGDVLLARDVELHLQSEGEDYPFAFIKERLKGLVVANFEAAIPDMHVATPYGSTVFSVDKNLLDGLVRSGITYLSLANNHSRDFGTAGLVNTHTELRGRGFTTFGHPESASSTGSVRYVEAAGKTIALIGLNYIVENPPLEEYVARVQSATYGSDLQIVYVHWGEEYKETSNAYQQAVAATLVAAGADVIVGHHPHVVQEVGFIDNVPVFYSLGNLIFDQYFSQAVQEGLMIEMKAEGSGLSFTLVPVTSMDSRAQPRLMSSASSTEFLSALAAKSSEELRADLKRGEMFIPLP